jgi:hypothetical protein
MADPLAAVKVLVDELDLANLAGLQEYIANKTISSPTDIPHVSHVVIVGPVEKPHSATDPVTYISCREARITKARDYRRTIGKAVATYCLYTGHSFFGCFLGEEMNPRERSDGEGGRVTDGREQHYTLACKGGPDSTLLKGFAFGDGLIQHLLLSQRSRRQQALTVSIHVAIENSWPSLTVFCRSQCCV